jgi:uncharacterized membrane protein YqiK
MLTTENIILLIPVGLLLLIALVPPLRTWFMQLLFGLVFIPEHCVGLVIKKFTVGNKKLPEGKIVATNGEAGYQAQMLSPGLHWRLWTWQYEIKLQELINVPAGQICLISAKDGKPLPTGQLLARYEECDNFQDAVKFMSTGYKGKQTRYLATGKYKINTHLFDFEIVYSKKVNQDKVGIVTTRDGVPLEDDAIACIKIEGHNKFQDADKFLAMGGQRGLQSEVILSGEYYINPWFAGIEEVDMIQIPIGNCGVVVSYFGAKGEDVSGVNFTHGNIVENGRRGVWRNPLEPGKYPINTKIMSVELVSTTNIVLNWADARTEAHNLDANLCTIKVRSKDGFSFSLDVSQIIHIPLNRAPEVIARFGSMVNLVNQVLEPTIGNYFRNSAQNSDVIEFLSNRVQRQEEAKKAIREVLEQYGVIAVDTLINDIVPPAELMKTLTDRKLAQETDATYKEQIKTQQTRQEFEKNKSLADIQNKLVESEQNVVIAERTADAAIKRAEGEKKSVQLAADAALYKQQKDAEGQSYKASTEAEGQAKSIKALGDAEAGKIQTIGMAEAEKIRAIGQANAEAFLKARDALGADNFTKMKMIDAIGVNKVEIMPKVLISGQGGGNAVDALLGIRVLQDLEGGLFDKHKDVNE